MRQKDYFSIGDRALIRASYKDLILVNSYNENKSNYFFIKKGAESDLINANVCPVSHEETRIILMALKKLGSVASLRILACDSATKIADILSVYESTVERIKKVGSLDFIKLFRARLKSKDKRPIIDLCEQNLANFEDNKCSMAITKIAIMENKLSLVFFLIKKGALNLKYYSIPEEQPLSITVDFDRYDIFKLLIEYKTYNLRELGYALEKAAKMKKLQYIGHIVSSNLDLRNISEKVFEIMVYTLEHNHIDIFTIFFNLNIVNINKQDHKGASLLMIAAKNSNLDIMDDLISKGANIELTDANGCTAFMNAASDNNTIVMEKLLDFNCNIYTPDFDNVRPIQFIVCHDNYGILSRIITQISPSDLVQDDLLNTCAELDLVEITKLICSRLTNEINFTNQEGETALFTAIDNNKIKISEILLQQNIDPNIISNNKWSPLQLVATKGNYEITKKILETGKVDINLASNEVNTPLYLAAKKGHTKICLELIKHGAYLEKTTNMNRTPLVTAIRHNKTETALQLLDAGALPNNRDNYNDGPLIFAASRGDITIIKKIIRLDRARELDSGNKNGETATYWAAKNGHSYVLKKLVESYNSINISDNNGITPLNSAIQNQQSSTAKFLLNLGADFSNKSSDGSPKISQLISMGISRSFLTDSIMDIANFSEEEKIEVIQVSANNSPQYSAFLTENNIFATTPPMTPPASPIQNIRKNMYNVL